MKFFGFKRDNDGSSLGFSDRKSVEIDSKPLPNSSDPCIMTSDVLVKMSIIYSEANSIPY